jgi:serine/threonine-protein kinase mTOR
MLYMLVITLYLIPSQRPIKDILHSYWLATHYDSTWYKAWHTWALANFDVVGYLESQSEEKSELPGDELAVHIVQAVDGIYLKFSVFLTWLRLL